MHVSKETCIRNASISKRPRTLIYILEFSVSSPAAVSSRCLAGVLESLRVLLEKSFMTTEYKVTVGETVKNDRRGKETYQVVFLLRTCRKPA